MRNTQHAGTRWFRLGVMAISIGLIGGLSGCEDDGSGDQPGDGSSHHGGSGRLAVDIFGNRGGVLTAVPSGLCLGEARVLWSNGVRGFSTDDSAPDQPLTASVSCGWVSASQTLVPQNVFSAPSVFAVLKADRTLAVWGAAAWAAIPRPCPPNRKTWWRWPAMNARWPRCKPTAPSSAGAAPAPAPASPARWA